MLMVKKLSREFLPPQDSFPCGYCCGRFTTEEDLVNHVEVAHGDEASGDEIDKVYRCEPCQRKFR